MERPLETHRIRSRSPVTGSRRWRCFPRAREHVNSWGHSNGTVRCSWEITAGEVALAEALWELAANGGTTGRDNMAEWCEYCGHRPMHEERCARCDDCPILTAFLALIAYTEKMESLGGGE